MRITARLGFYPEAALRATSGFRGMEAEKLYVQVPLFDRGLGRNKASQFGFQDKSPCRNAPPPRSSLARRHLQYPLERDIRRRLPYHDLKIARHDPPVHVDIEQLEIFRGKLQGYGFRFTRLK